MMPRFQTRRIGWIAILAACFVAYFMIVMNGNSVRSKVVQAERRIVQLEQQNMLLETEYLTRSSQVQLARWNRVDFGYDAPSAAQFIHSERELADFGDARGSDAPAPIRLAGHVSGEEMRAFPKLVSPMTGRPVDGALEVDDSDVTAQGGPLENAEAQGDVRVASVDEGVAENSEVAQTLRIPLEMASASAGSAALEAAAR